MNTQLFIENYELDITADISTLLTFELDNVKDFASRSTTWSKTIVLPGTANNNKLFGHIFQVGQANAYSPSLGNVNYNYNASKAADCIIFQDQMQVFKGVLRLMQINIDRGRIEYEVAAFGEIAGLNVALSGGLLEELDFSAYNHTYNAGNVTGSWANTSGVNYYYPLIDHGTYSTTKDDWDIRTFRPALHVREYIDKMITTAGFRWESDLFDTPRFKTLIVPYNQKQLTSTDTDILDVSQTGGSYTAVVSDPLIIQIQKNGVDILNQAISRSDTTHLSIVASFSTGDILKVLIEGTPITFPTGDIGLFTTSDNITFTYAGTTTISTTIYFDIVTSYTVISGDDITQNYSSDLSAQSATGVPVPISPGDSVVMNETIPKNIRQIDFLSSIIKLFNLYVYEDQFDSRLIKFKPYVDYYSQDVYPPDIVIADADALSSSTDFGSSVILSNRNYVAGRLYLIAIQVSKDTAPNEPSIAGTGQTWTKIADVSSRTMGSPTSRLAVFRFLATATITEDTTITIPTGVLHTGRSTVEIELTGVDTTGVNGADAIVQAVTDSGDAEANPSILMAPISNSRNAVFAFFTNNANPFGATVESGWTLLTNSGYGTPDTGMITISRLTTTDNTPSVTASASDWAGIAVEIKSQDAETVDWTYKLNRDKVIKIRPMSELNAKKYDFKYKSDSDFYNEAYRKRYGQGYGDYTFDSAYEFAEQTNSLELIFSATPLVGYTGEDKVFSTIFKQSNDVEERIDSNIRILQSKKITGVTSWDIKDGVSVLSSQTTYGYAGHFDDPDAPSNDLNFGALNELFFTLVSGDLTKTQFNVYWSAYMAEITDKDSKLFAGWFYLTAKDIINLDFSKKVWIDGVLFRLNSIKDYNCSNPEDCQVELLKIGYLIY